MVYYDSREWKLLRDSVVNRDRYTCQECGYEKNNKEDRKLSAHHVIPRKEGGADHPENLVTLCSRCHPKLEGDEKNPRNPEDRVFEEIIDELSKETIKHLVNSEIDEGKSIYYKLILDNPYVCSNCHEYQYTVDGKYINIESSGKDFENIISSNFSLGFIPNKKSPLCFSCQQLDLIWSGDKTMNKDELFEHGHKISEYLDESGVVFNKDIFYDALRQLKQNSDMQWKNRKILKYAVEYSVEL
jgi:hypothetical protein